jgi:hypothetical protein
MSRLSQGLGNRPAKDLALEGKRLQFQTLSVLTMNDGRDIFSSRAFPEQPACEWRRSGRHGLHCYSWQQLWSCPQWSLRVPPARRFRCWQRRLAKLLSLARPRLLPWRRPRRLVGIKEAASLHLQALDLCHTMRPSARDLEGRV